LSLLRRPQIKSALITGINGQDGQYLASFLNQMDYKIFGLFRGQKPATIEEFLSNYPYVIPLIGDITDQNSLSHALDISQPSEIYNLAAVSFVGNSWIQPHHTTNVNAIGTLNLLEAVRQFQMKVDFQVRVYQASSSEMFGKVQEVPQSEKTSFWPRSPYGVSKTFGHHISVNYRESYNLYVVSGILFNHESPLRGTEFVTRKVTQKVARISLGLEKYINLGNLEARRDWGFAGDYVKAMWKMLQPHDAEDYVICTGVTHSVADLVQIAFESAGIEHWQDHIKIDKDFIRPAEVNLLLGDYTKAKNQLNWEPNLKFRDLVGMMVRADLERLRDVPFKIDRL